VCRLSRAARIRSGEVPGAKKLPTPRVVTTSPDLIATAFGSKTNR
jgi:hypothetical protein